MAHDYIAYWKNEMDKIRLPPTCLTFNMCKCGKLDKILELVTEGEANFNYTDSDGITCLMVACSKGHPTIVRYLVNEVGVDVNRVDKIGQTALHKCAESPSAGIEILIFLIENGAKTSEVDSYGKTPIFYTIHNKSSRDGDEKQAYLQAIVNIEDRVNAIEYDGVRNCDIQRGFMGFRTKILWKEAMRERTHPKPIHHSSLRTALNHEEFTTMEELNVMDTNEIVIQVVLVTDRFLGCTHPFTITRIYECARFYYWYSLPLMFDRCYDLLTFLLSEYKFLSNPMLKKTFCLLVALFKTKYTIYLPLCYPQMVYEKCAEVIGHYNRMKNITRKKRNYYINQILVVALDLIYLITKLSRTQGESTCFLKTTRYLVMNDKTGWKSLLHLACSKKNNFFKCSFPQPDEDVVNLLLTVGANPNARDKKYGDTPLHCYIRENSVIKSSIITSLLRAGTHFDTANANGLSTEDLLNFRCGEMKIKNEEQEEEEDDTDLCVFISKLRLKYTTLQCLAAKTVKNIYQRFSEKEKVEKIPHNLISIVNQH